MLKWSVIRREMWVSRVVLRVEVVAEVRIAGRTAWLWRVPVDVDGGQE